MAQIFNQNFNRDRLTADLKIWQGYLTQQAHIIGQFTKAMDAAQTQIDVMQNTLDALITRVDNIQESVISIGEQVASFEGMKCYVKISDPYTTITGTTNQTYTKSIGVFTNKDTIYVFASKTVAGLYLDNAPVVKGLDDNNMEKPFYTFSGSDSGTRHKLRSSGELPAGTVNLIFTTEPHCGAGGGVYADASTTMQIKMLTKRISITRLEPIYGAPVGAWANSITNQMADVQAIEMADTIYSTAITDAINAQNITNTYNSVVGSFSTSDSIQSALGNTPSSTTTGSGSVGMLGSYTSGHSIGGNRVTGSTGSHYRP